MIRRVLFLFSAVWSLASAQTPCFPVTGAQIFGEDLARAIPAFGSIPRNLPLAPSPLPGSTRMFAVAELQTLATRFGLHDALLSDTCFQIATEPLNREQVLAAMMDALKLPAARVEILETSNQPVPAGRIEFRRENLGSPANPSHPAPVMWRGDVIYAGDRKFAVWARVNVTAPRTRLIAATELRATVTIDPGQVREEVIETFPLASAKLVSLSQLSGMIPVRTIAAGAEITLDNLTRPNEVNRGDTVHVDVSLGAAHLALTGRAESPGRIGDIVPVRNLESSRVFQARVDGPDRVIVQLSSNSENSR